LKRVQLRGCGVRVELCGTVDGCGVFPRKAPPPMSLFCCMMPARGALRSAECEDGVAAGRSGCLLVCTNNTIAEAARGVVAWGASEVAGNEITACDTSGVWVESGSVGVRVANNLIDASGQGIVFKDASGECIENTVKRSRASGIALDSSCVVVDGNLCEFNAAHGVYLHGEGAQVTIERTECNGNGADGVHAGGHSGAVRVLSSSAVENKGGGIQLGSCGGECRENEVVGNKMFGIAASTLSHVVLADNIVKDTGGIGIILRPPLSNGSRPKADGGERALSRSDAASSPSLASEIRGNDISHNSACGVCLEGCRALEFGGNTVRDNSEGGVQSSQCLSPLFRDNKIHDNGGCGLTVLGGNTPEVRSNSIFSNTIGLSLGESDGRILNNRIYGNSKSGLCGEGGAPIVECNHIEGNGGSGVHLSRCASGTFVENEIASNAEDGITSEGECWASFTDNLVQENGGCGACLNDAAGGVLERNRFVRNKGVGVFLGTSCTTRLQGNTLECNKGGGMLLLKAGGIRATQNKIRKNGGDGVCVADEAGEGQGEDGEERGRAEPVFSENTLEENRGCGFLIYGRSARGNINCNSVLLHEGAGVRVEEGATTEFFGNTLHRNASGVEVGVSGRGMAQSRTHVVRRVGRHGL